MKIVIAGAGEVGSHLAKLLSYENQDIVLVDRDASKLAAIDANYNLMTMVGSPTSFNALREAGVEDCDLFIAVTPYESTNVISCSIAKQIGAGRTVARIDNYEFMINTLVEGHIEEDVVCDKNRKDVCAVLYFFARTFLFV